MSSATPSRQTSVAPATIPRACRGWANTPERKGICAANVMATTSPAHIATPPRRGVGTVCTSRSRTGVVAPATRASSRARGVARKVTAVAISMTSR